MLLYWLILLFYVIKTNEGKVSNEILSILPAITSDVLSLPNVTTVFLNHKSTESVKVSNRTLLRIPLLDSKISPLVCFPETEDDYKNVFILSHVSCRMMGFMTFSSIRAKRSPDRARIKSTNLSCSGIRDASQCKSLQNATEYCRKVTEVTCGACNGTIKGLKGVIKSPGFPIVSLNDVTCEWNIIVPEHHSLVLSFNQFDTMDTESADIPCGVHRPYVQIMYGIQSTVTIHRYCRLSEVKKLNIPFHSVKIIVFTGLEPKRETRITKNGLGISITFEATVPTEESYGSPLKMLAFFLLGVIFIVFIILCHYVQKYKLCDCIVKDRDTQFLADPYDLNSYKTRIENEKLYLNKCHKEDAVKVEIQRNPKMVYESGKGLNEYSNLLDTSAGFISSVTPRNSDANKEQLNADLHMKLNLAHSYHGQEDPHRLSVSSPKDYNDYHSFMTSRHASSASCMTQEKKKIKSSMSTC